MSSIEQIHTFANSNTETAPQIPVDQPELTITIAGRAGTGKSTLALFIAMCLEKAGVNVAAINDEVTEEQQAFMVENLKANLSTIAARQAVITINMDQLKKDKVELVVPPEKKLYFPPGVR